MGSKKPHGPNANETGANDLGALALFGSEAESSIEPRVVGREPYVPQPYVRHEPQVPTPSQDSVRHLRSRLVADSRPVGLRSVLSRGAALKLAVGDYASTVRSLLAPRLREYLVRHPKLPGQAGLIACIVVAAVIVGHFVGRIDVVRIDQALSQPSSPEPVASEPLTGESPVLTTPIAAPAVQGRSGQPPDVRNAQLRPAPKAPAPKAPAPKVQASKPQQSTIDTGNSSSRSRRAENPRPREIAREASTSLRTRAPDTVIAPPPTGPPTVAASVRPTATPSSVPALPVQTTIINNVDDEGSSHIYSAQDVDVRPPKMLGADLPRPAVTNWPTIKNSMEVVVMEDGSVERVKWLTAGERMPDVMLLSRAKLWKFSPAVRDGRPVRYRLIVTWEVNP